MRVAAVCKYLISILRRRLLGVIDQENTHGCSARIQPDTQLFPQAGEQDAHHVDLAGLRRSGRDGWKSGRGFPTSA